MILADFINTFCHVILSLLLLRFAQMKLKPGPTDNAIAFLIH